MKFIETTESAWSPEQLAAAAREIEEQKREWEQNRLAAMREEEERRARELEEEGDIITFSREDATNQVSTKTKKLINKSKKLLIKPKDKSNKRLTKRRRSTLDRKRRKGKFKQKKVIDTEVEENKTNDSVQEESQQSEQMVSQINGDTDSNSLSSMEEYNASFSSIKNHLDHNSPRTRSRGTVAINLWTLDISPILPGEKPLRKRPKSSFSEEDSSDTEGDEENHDKGNVKLSKLNKEEQINMLFHNGRNCSVILTDILKEKKNKFVKKTFNRSHTHGIQKSIKKQSRNDRKRVPEKLVVDKLQKFNTTMAENTEGHLEHEHSSETTDTTVNLQIKDKEIPKKKISLSEYKSRMVTDNSLNKESGDFLNESIENSVDNITKEEIALTNNTVVNDESRNVENESLAIKNPVLNNPLDNSITESKTELNDRVILENTEVKLEVAGDIKHEVKSNDTAFVLDKNVQEKTSSSYTDFQPPAVIAGDGECNDYQDRDYRTSTYDYGDHDYRTLTTTFQTTNTSYQDAGPDYQGSVHRYRDADSKYQNVDYDYRNVDQNYKSTDRDYRNVDQTVKSVEHVYGNNDQNHQSSEQNYNASDHDYRNKDQNYQKIDQNYKVADHDYKDVDYRDISNEYQKANQDYRDGDHGYRKEDPEYRDDYHKTDQDYRESTIKPKGNVRYNRFENVSSHMDNGLDNFQNFESRGTYGNFRRPGFRFPQPRRPYRRFRKNTNNATLDNWVRRAPPSRSYYNRKREASGDNGGGSRDNFSNS